MYDTVEVPLTVDERVDDGDIDATPDCELVLEKLRVAEEEPLEERHREEVGVVDPHGDGDTELRTDFVMLGLDVDERVGMASVPVALTVKSGVLDVEWEMLGEGLIE